LKPPKQKFLLAVAIIVVAACLIGAKPAIGFGSSNSGEKTWLSSLRLQ
jgi:hypothetical protein